MINRVVLVGRLTRDPELKYTHGGATVASFTLAVNRTFTNSKGEREADFIDCVIWRKAAENFANLVHKGLLIGIDGRLQTRNYENQQGQKVYVTEVVVDNFSKLEWDGSKTTDSLQNNSTGGNGSSNNANPNQAPSYNQSNNSNTNMSDPFADNSKPIDISDDSLPF